MPSFTQLITLAALAVAASASAINPIVARAAAAGHTCPDASVAQEASIDVGGGKMVTLTSFQCATDAAVARRDTTPRNVCGGLTTCACNSNAGNLPPISEDCDTIENAIQILQAHLSTFVVQPGNLQTLTFGTCSYFFKNSAQEPLQYCWHDLAVTGSTAGSRCFPPIQPINSEGLCTSTDQSWAVGAAHSVQQ